MKKKSSWRLHCFFLLVMSLSVHAIAGIVISPVHVYLSHDKPVAAVTILNQTSKPRMFNVVAYAWRQKQGKDQLTSSSELIISPPIFRIEPGQSQIVRIGSLGNTRLNQEKDFRVLFKQIPLVDGSAERSNPSKNGLTILLSFSIPVFLAPVEKTPLLMQASIQRMPKHKLKLHLINQSNQHVKIEKIILKSIESHASYKLTLGDYLLAGQAHDWVLSSLPKYIYQARKIQLIEQNQSGKTLRSMITLGGKSSLMHDD